MGAQLETEEIKAVLRELNNSNNQILLSMIVSSDGFTLAHEGDAIDPDKVAASYIELQIVAEKIMSGLEYGNLEEVFVRSGHGCIAIMPISDKGILACMSKPDLTSGTLQILTWKTINTLNKLMSD